MFSVRLLVLNKGASGVFVHRSNVLDGRDDNLRDGGDTDVLHSDRDRFDHEGLLVSGELVAHPDIANVSSHQPQH